MTRKQKILSVLLGAVLVLSVVAATYAYFTASVNRTGNTGIVEVTTTQLANLTMTSMKSAEGSPIYPGWVGYQGINVSATGSGSSYYDLSLEITGGSNVKGDVLVTICKVEDSLAALAAGDFTFTAATAQVDTSYSPVRYYMTNGSITLPSPCTNIVSAVTLASLGSSYQLTASGGKEIVAGKNDKYYISYTYENKGQNQVQGENFTVTPVISARGGVSSPQESENAVYLVFYNTSMTIGDEITNELELEPEGVQIRDNPNDAMADWQYFTDIPGDTRPFYIKYILNDNNEIERIYLEFVINDTLKAQWKANYCNNDVNCETKYDNLVNGTYTLRGGINESSSPTKPIYEENVNTIKRAFNYTAQPNIFSEYDNSFGCYLTGIAANATYEGVIDVEDRTALYCSSSGGVSCNWYG